MKISVKIGTNAAFEMTVEDFEKKYNHKLVMDRYYSNEIAKIDDKFISKMSVEMLEDWYIRFNDVKTEIKENK